MASAGTPGARCKTRWMPSSQSVTSSVAERAVDPHSMNGAMSVVHAALFVDEALGRLRL